MGSSYIPNGRSLSKLKDFLDHNSFANPLDYLDKKPTWTADDVRHGVKPINDLLKYATDFAYGKLIARHGYDAWENVPLFTPRGRYTLDDVVDLPWLHGFGFRGSGVQNTRFTQTKPGVPCFRFNYVSYGDIENFTTEAYGQTDGAHVEIDANGDPAYEGHALKVQRLNITSIHAVGGQFGLRICKSGGGAQGDTIVIYNYGGEQFNDGAGICIGYPGLAYNALGVDIINGCIQSSFPDAVRNYGGQCHVLGMNFENQGPWGKEPRQIREGGADLKQVGGTSALSTAYRTRHESPVPSIGFRILRDVVSYAASIEQYNPSQPDSKIGWQPGKAFERGMVIAGSPGPFNPKWDGKPYICVKDGRSGTTEPPWSDTPPFFYRRDMRCFAGDTRVANAFPDTRVVDARLKDCWCYIRNAGANETSHFSKVDAVDDQFAVILHDAPAHSIAFAVVAIAKGIVDGTVEWMPYEFHAAEGVTRPDNVNVAFGRVLLSPPDGPVFGVIGGTRRDLVDASPDTVGIGETVLVQRIMQGMIGAPLIPGSPNDTPLWLPHPDARGQFARLRLDDPDARGRRALYLSSPNT